MLQPASAQEREFENIARPIASYGASKVAVEKEDEEEEKIDFIVVPIPLSNPTIGTGLAGGLMAVYPQKGDAPSSNTIVGGFYTNSDSWGIGVNQKNYLKNDKLRLNVMAAYADLQFDFWGVGFDAGDNNTYVGINQTAFIFKPELLWETFDNLYIGPQISFLYAETSADSTLPGDGGPDDIVNETGDLANVGLGIAADYDTRNNPLNASTGWFVEADAVFNRGAWGSDQDFERYVVNINNYIPLTDKQVLAWQASGCMSNGNAPFYELCLFGANRRIRGYPVGQYQDKRMLSGQAEWRWNFLPRWGVVAFGGMGQVGSSFSNFESGNVLISGGVGARWMASVESRVNLSVDYALGENDDYLYIYVGEAF